MGREAQQVAIGGRSYGTRRSIVSRAVGSLSEPLQVQVEWSWSAPVGMAKILSNIAQISNGQNTLHSRFLVTSLRESGIKISGGNLPDY